MADVVLTPDPAVGAGVVPTAWTSPFSAAATAELLKYAKTGRLKLELRTNFAESDDWQEFRWVPNSLALQFTGASPSVLKFTLINTAYALSIERSRTNRCQLFTEARLTAYMAEECEWVFQGRIDEESASGAQVTLTCRDWTLLLEECDGIVEIRPSWAEVVDDVTGREVVRLGTTSTYIFGFEHDGTTSDPAFGELAQLETPQRLIRRPWMPTGVRLWRDAAMTEGVGGEVYEVNSSSGCITILENLYDTSVTPAVLRRYWVSNVRAVKESTATGATNIDLARGFEQLVQTAKPFGIGALSAECDIPDTGIDFALPYEWDSKAQDMIVDLRRTYGEWLKFWWESRTGKWTLRIIDQKASGSEDWTLVRPTQIRRVRTVKDLYTRIRAKGAVEMPQNLLAQLGASAITQGDGTPFLWTKLNGGNDTAFETAILALFDGDANKGYGAHGLPGNSNTTWYTLVTIDTGEQRKFSRVRAWLPPSANPNSPTGHNGYFWPGLRIQISDDGIDWLTMSPYLDGRYKPGSEIDVPYNKLAVARGRYLKVLCGAFKQGISNSADLAIGLMSLMFYCEEEYDISREIVGVGADAYEYHNDWDNDGTADSWARLHADLYTRVGSRHRTNYLNWGRRYPRVLGEDLTITHLAEAVRIFEGITYSSVWDPRPRRFQTVLVNDYMTGLSNSILVEGMTITDHGAEFEGANYLATPLDNGGA